MDTSKKYALQDKVESIRYHLEGLASLVGELPDESGRPAVSFEAVELQTFANWTLDLLGFDVNADTSTNVRAARRILVAAMAGDRHNGNAGSAQEPFDISEVDFVDLFADSDPEEEVDADLTIDPLAGVEDE